MVFLRICVLIILIGLVVACKQQEKQQLDLHDWNPIKVTVTAYNSLPWCVLILFRIHLL